NHDVLFLENYLSNEDLDKVTNFVVDSGLSTFAVTKLDNESTIVISSSNQLIIQPAHHNGKQYDIAVKINSRTFVSNTERNKLVCGTDELSYHFAAGKYYINLIDEFYGAYIPEVEADFDVCVTYIEPSKSTDSQAKDTVANSDETVATRIETACAQTAVSSATRFEQGYKFNVNSLLTYKLLINEGYVFTLDPTLILDNVLTINAVDIYERIPLAHLSVVNSARLVVACDGKLPILANADKTFRFTFADSPELSSSKNNGVADNSTYVHVVLPEHTVETVLSFYNLTEQERKNVINKVVQTESAAADVKYSLDSVCHDLAGDIYVSAYSKATGSYTDGGNTIDVFNSEECSALKFTKLSAVASISSDAASIMFSAVNNAEGYDIYVDGIKKNIGLFVGTKYSLEGLSSGVHKISVRSIAKEKVGNAYYSNSNNSAEFEVTKFATPVLTTERGELCITLDEVAYNLFKAGAIEDETDPLNSSTNCILYIDNGVKELYFDKSHLNLNLHDDTFEVAISGLEILTYGDILQSETLKVGVKIKTATDGKVYVESNLSSIEVIGLLPATSVVVNNNSLSWYNNPLNTIEGVQSVVDGYQVCINYGGKDYYTYDTKLKYYDASSASYKSYDNIITSTNVPFPAGYDNNDDGELSDVEKFTTGDYYVSVITIPNDSTSYNLLDSNYSAFVNFTRLETPAITTVNGKLSWVDKSTASKLYELTIYNYNDGEYNTVNKTVTLVSPSYDFADIEDSGLFAVTIQAKSQTPRAIDSAVSEKYYVFRLPKVESATVNDGRISFNAAKSHNKIILTFVDEITGEVRINVGYNNKDIISEFGIEDWDEITPEKYASLMEVQSYYTNFELVLESERVYSLNTMLMGNSANKLMIVNSADVKEIDDLKVVKLKTNMQEVASGVYKFYTNDIAIDTYDKEIYKLNYHFSTEETSEFYKDTIIYNLKLATNGQEYSMFAIDYDSFVENMDKLNPADYTIYEEVDAMAELYACVRYHYKDTYLYFNVFKDNHINLANYSWFKFFQTTIVEDHLQYSSSSTPVEITLTNGGTYMFNCNVLGGDGLHTTREESEGEGTVTRTYHTGFITSKDDETITFSKYASNTVSTRKGLISFVDYIQKDDAGNVKDYPIYKLSIKKANTEEQVEAQIVYVYYNGQEANAREITGNDANAIYVEATYDVSLSSTILFDLAKFKDVFAAGQYTVQIRTLSGNSNTQNNFIYIDADVPLDTYVVSCVFNMVICTLQLIKQVKVWHIIPQQKHILTIFLSV
ncbi:MAG: hypothetical protein MJ149_00845, partial [Clostridia bacterium]|nr:hypothetical protein [Clostridia bacterium]